LKGHEEWRERGVKAQQELLKWMHPRANTSDIGMRTFLLLFFYYLDLSPAVCIHRADESKGPSPLLPQNFVALHNLGQKFLADKGETRQN
jgi:hypothetical protein